MKQLISTCIGVVVMIAAAIGEEASPNSIDGPKEGSAIIARTLTEHVFEKNASTYYLFDKEIFEQLHKLAQTKPTYPPGTGFSSGEPWAEVLVSGEIPKSGSTETARFSVCVENSYDLAPDESLIFRISSISLSRIDGKSGTTVTSRFGYYEKAEVLDHLLSRICKAAGIALPKAASPNEQLAPRTKAVYSCQDEDVVNNVVRLAKSAKVEPDVTANGPVATVLVTPLKNLLHDRAIYVVDLFAESGLMRISVREPSGPAKVTMRTLGYVTDTGFWRLLCSKYGTPRKDTRGH